MALDKYIYPAEDTAVEKAAPVQMQKLDQRTGETVTYEYIPSTARRAWFHRFCAYHGIVPNIYTDLARDRKAEPEGGYSEVVKAVVYMNGTPIASGLGSERSLNLLDPQIRIIETAETYAIGRALANAGFTLPNEKDLRRDGDGQGSCADAPMRIDTPVNPAPAQPQATDQTAPPSQFSAASDPNQVDELILIARQPGAPASLQEAFAVKCPVRGMYYGNMLGEINVSAPHVVRFYAGNGSKPFGSASDFPYFVAAAKMIVEANT